LPPHFRGRNLEKLDEYFRNTIEPLHIRALPASAIHVESFNNVAFMLNKYVHRLRALLVRAVTPDLVGPFLQQTLFPKNLTRHVVTSLGELDIAVKLDPYDEQPLEVPVASVLQDAAETFPSLKNLTLPGLSYMDYIPTPNSSSVFSNLSQLQVNGAGISNGSPFYDLFRFLHLYASKADGVSLRKLAIHRAERLSSDVILAAGRRGQSQC
jgi:hypothetical protein